ncbi:MAG: glutathione peroxidase [Chitinophagaceae bacterium]|jgi:glutathione peroxidase
MTLATFLLFSFLFAPATKTKIPDSIYEFKITSLEGTEIDFADFKGKKILIVNTASKCGFTPQYKDLEKLYQQYKGKLVVVGFPANNFLFQEPGNNEHIASFCERNYGVSFPMSEKVSVKGKHKASIYSWLTQKKYNGFKDSKVKWNFQKYLIDENGKLIAIFNPGQNPLSPEIVKAIEE